MIPYLNIKGTKYKIILKVDPYIGDDPVNGYCDVKNKIICVNKNLDKKEFMHVFIHECLHALFFEVGLWQTTMSDDMEHIIIENTTSFLIKNFKVEKS